MHISFENLIRKLVDLRENNEKNPFEKEFDCIDILIIEDIQFIIGKKSIEKGTLSLLDYLINKKVQIILSCDINPSKLDFCNLDLKKLLWKGFFIPISKNKCKVGLKSK